MKATAKMGQFEITVKFDAHDPAEVEAARQLLWNGKDEPTEIVNNFTKTTTWEIEYSGDVTNGT